MENQSIDSIKATINSISISANQKQNYNVNGISICDSITQLLEIKILLDIR